MSIRAARQYSLSDTNMTRISDHDTVAVHDALSEHAWALDDLDHSSKDANLFTGPVRKPFSRKRSLNDWRSSTLSQPDLRDRYDSSEEEPSPSPDSETGSQFDDQENDEPENEGRDSVEFFEEGNDTDKDEDNSALMHYEDAQPELAIAVPILAMGRPKLVDITSLAPIHKRKRSTDSQNTITRIPSGARAIIPLASPEQSTPYQERSFSITTPNSWLPDDSEILPETQQEDAVNEGEEHPSDLRLQDTPTYSDYDPYSLNPPRLSPIPPLSTPSKKPGSVARARKQVSQAPGLRSIRRSLSGTKRQEVAATPRQLTKKPKMLARGATERTATPFIPM